MKNTFTKVLVVVTESGSHILDTLIPIPCLLFQVGLVYMFNLIVGTGALTMPKAFATAGWVVSIALISFLGFMRWGLFFPSFRSLLHEVTFAVSCLCSFHILTGETSLCIQHTTEALSANVMQMTNLYLKQEPKYIELYCRHGRPFVFSQSLL